MSLATVPANRRKPEESRSAILEAALVEFAAKGLAGARVDQIAARSKANKQLVYYYFGSKENLYSATLEAAYEEIRSREQALRLGSLPPGRAMERLVGFSFDYLRAHPGFIRLLNDANAHGAAHIQGSPAFEKQNSPLVILMEETLRRGVSKGLFRSGIDPVWLYVSIAGMAYFYFSNQATLSVIFGRDLSRDQVADAYRSHTVTFAMAAIRQECAAVQPNG